MFPNCDERMSECGNVPLQHEAFKLLENYKTKFVVDDDDDVLVADLTEVKVELERDLSKLQDGAHEKMVIEILLVL